MSKIAKFSSKTLEWVKKKLDKLMRDHYWNVLDTPLTLVEQSDYQRVVDCVKDRLDFQESMIMFEQNIGAQRHLKDLPYR